ncbi:sensor protein EvgS precursor [bacterium BMS3Abin04]|nr:sensor protein EvgS precursor [bacterium BMS3Abin04]
MSQPLKIVKLDPVPPKRNKEDNNFNDENKQDIEFSILLPLKIAATLTALAGVLALIFEVKSVIGHSFEIYLSRLFVTVASFVVLVAAQTKIGKNNSEALAHAFLFSVVLSFGFTVYRLPSQFFISALLVMFLIFTLSLFLTWENKHQIIAIGYYSVIFGAIFFLQRANLSFFTNLSSILSIVFLGMLSVFINRITSKNKIKAIENFNALLGDLDASDVKNEEKPTKNNFVDNSDFGMFQISSDGRIALVNKGFCKLLGYDNENEIYSNNFGKDILADPAQMKKLKKTVQNNKFLKTNKINLKQKSGSELPVELHLRYVSGTKKQNGYYEGSFYDISEYFEKENLLRNELKKLKEEKNTESKNATTAKYSNNVKTKFIASMSHEIRTPMNSVLGFLTLIENGLFESENELKDFARNAKMSAESLLDIINNILDLSKIEAGKMELEISDFNLIEEVKKGITIVSPLAREKGLELKLKASPDIPMKLYGDATKYRQVLVNILNNAVKFTDEGGITIEVDIQRKTEAIIKILTSITDSGKGISEEKIKAIFKPFTRLDNSTLSANEGTGLGLMISKEFVNIMKGDISVESKLDEGSKFMFSVVLSLDKEFSIDNDLEYDEIIEESNDAREEQETVEPIENNIDDRKIQLPINKRDGNNKKRLLLVEDNPISQKVELKLLRESGYYVDSVNNGYDAIEAVKSGKFNLVLMDIEMSDINGLDATKSIRGMDPPVNNIPIIAVTAHSSMKDREKCLAAGMDDYIAKPININFLKMTIDQWLNEERL